MDKLGYLRKSMDLDENFDSIGVGDDLTKTLSNAIVYITNNHSKSKLRYASSSDEEEVKRFIEILLQTISILYDRVDELESKINETRWFITNCKRVNGSWWKG